MTEEEYHRVLGFDPSVAGKRAECDGGSVSSTGQAAREEFAGTLTGEYFEEGNPPWRWYFMNELTLKPDDHPEGEGVWCETGFLFVMDK